MPNVESDILYVTNYRMKTQLMTMNFIFKPNVGLLLLYLTCQMFVFVFVFSFHTIPDVMKKME